MDLLKETFPSVSRLTILWSSIAPPETRARELDETKMAAERLGLELQSLEVSNPGDLQTALESATRGRVQAVVTVGDLISWTGIVSFASRNELPTMADRSEFVFAGGLMAYALSYADLYKRAALYVDKILKGALPAELPVERPKRIQLIINLQTAQALGLAIPQSVLAQADQVVPVIFK
jgi:putative ABC transport system substrate-binding protein